MAYTAPAGKRVHRETRRDQILAWMIDYIRVHHNAPSTREIARKFDLAHQTVQVHMNKLDTEGRITRVDGLWKVVGAEYVPPEES